MSLAAKAAQRPGNEATITQQSKLSRRTLQTLSARVSVSSLRIQSMGERKKSSDRSLLYKQPLSRAQLIIRPRIRY